MNITKYGSVWSPLDGNFKITGIMNCRGSMSRSLDISQGLFLLKFYPPRPSTGLKKSRSVNNGHLYNSPGTGLLNKEFIIWRKQNLFLRDEEGKPERVRLAFVACRVANQNAGCFTRPARSRNQPNDKNYTTDEF